MEKPSVVSSFPGSSKFHISPAMKVFMVLGALSIVSLLVVAFTGEKDLCENITCDHECYGTQLWKMICREGECVKDYLIELYSEDCGYTYTALVDQSPEPVIDSDRDGIPDNDDECYNPGCTLIDTAGCPKDTDGDGLQDCYDDCPHEWGERTNKGCPIKESIVRVEICNVNFDAPGNDNYNLNGEWVRICNTGNQDVNMSGWRLYDIAFKRGTARDHVFYFPLGFVLRAGQSVTVYSGSGVNTESSLYWGRLEGEYGAIWTNDGDCAYLEDNQGNLIDMRC
jgi:hypothetical protein